MAEPRRPAVPAPPPFKASPLRIERHRAERLGDLAVVGSVCCSSCCCCCCCVHAIGGVTGAAIGSGIAAQQGAGSEEGVGARIVTAGYWVGFGLVSLLVCVASALGDALLLGLGAVAVAAPLLQLLVSFFLLPFIAGMKGRRQAGGMRALLAITAGALAGAVLGGIAMGGLLLLVGVLAEL